VPKTTSENRKTRSQIKHQAIVDAAVLEFREKGFHGSSMDQISARGEVSKRTLYNHFKSKEVLFNSILDLIFNKVDVAFDFCYDPKRNLKEQLCQIAHQQIEISTADDFTDLVRVTMSEFIRRPELAQKVLPKSTNTNSKVFAFFTAAIKDGKLKKCSVQHLATQFFSLLKGFSFWPKMIFGTMEKDSKKLNFLVKDSVEMFLGHFGTGKKTAKV